MDTTPLALEDHFHVPRTVFEVSLFIGSGKQFLLMLLEYHE